MVATVDLSCGGRLASLTIHGTEVLAPPQTPDDLLHWGCYPLAPWAGRIRNAVFRFDNRAVQLDPDFPPHAIHGLGYRSPWTESGPGQLTCDLSELWEFGGRLDQRLVLSASSLAMTLSVTATTARMPAMLGWHPCFRRRLTAGGAEVEVDFDPGGMWERDATDIPTGRIVDVPARPWDDCFSGVSRAPVLTWPGQLSVRIESQTPTWVVFDELPEVVCVEPMIDAPDAFNREPTILEQGQTMTLTMRLSWEQLGNDRPEQEQHNA